VRVLLRRVYGLYPISPNFILYSVCSILLFEIYAGLCNVQADLLPRQVYLTP